MSKKVTWTEEGIFNGHQLTIATIDALPNGVKEKINAMIHSTFLSDMPEKDHLGELAEDCRLVLVFYAMQGDAVIACSTIQWLRTRSEGLGIVSDSLQFVIELGSAVVREAQRGRGLGTAMIEARLTRGLQIMQYVANSRNGLAHMLKLKSDKSKGTFDARRASKLLRENGIVRTLIEHGDRNVGHKERFTRISSNLGLISSHASQTLLDRVSSQVIVEPSDEVVVFIQDAGGVNVELVKQCPLDEAWGYAMQATGVEKDRFEDLGGAFGSFNTLKAIPELEWDSNITSTMLAWGFPHIK